MLLSKKVSLFFSAEDDLLASVPEKDRFYDEVVLPQKGRLELYYARHRTFWLDLEIIFQTALTVVTKRPRFPRRLRSLVDGFTELVEDFRRRVETGGGGEA